jgi:hypothetical protein
MRGISVSIDNKNLNKRLNRIQKHIDSSSKLTVQQIGIWTRDNIIRNMPKATGNSAASIVYKVERMTPNEKEVVITQGWRPHIDREWHGKWFNVPLWMFESPKAISHPWRNGSITTMRAIPGMAEVMFKQRIKQDLRSLNKI